MHGLPYLVLDNKLNNRCKQIKTLQRLNIHFLDII